MSDEAKLWTLDREGRAVVVGTQRVSLTELEVKCLAYLQDHAGNVVTRRDLERDVWGLAEGVDSHTTSVTVRNIRRKMGPTGKRVISTVFGVGWRLYEPQQWFANPRFPTPFFSRDGELHALRTLFDDGWRVITLIGPGGGGKTRLATAFVDSLPYKTVFVDLASARTTEDVERALVAAAGMAGGSLDALEMAIAGRKVVFLFDEAEGVIEGVAAVLPSLASHRVVITSRRPLNVAGEGVHQLKPLIGEEGAAFLEMQLRAARWNHPIAEELVQPLLTWVDGSALAIELIAAHPTPPAQLLARLQRGELPGSGMQTTLDRSYDQLGEAAKHTLHALTLCEGPITEEAVHDWLGPEGVEGLHGLIDHSLLHREADGWRLLRTLRSFVRAKSLDWAPYQHTFDRWLVDWCRSAEERIFTEPTAALDALSPLIDDLLDLIPRLHRADVEDLLWSLFLYSYMRGPHTIQDRSVELVKRHHPEVGFANILAAYSGSTLDPVALLHDLERARRRDQVRALVVFSMSWLPLDLSWIGGFAAGLSPDPEDELGNLYLRRLMLIFHPDPYGEAERLIADGADYRLLHWMTQHTVARMQSLRGEEIRAMRSWERLVAELSDQRQGGSLLFAVYGYADGLATVDRERSIQVFIEGAELGIRAGYGNTWAVGRAGLWLTLLGRDEQAGELLEHGVRGNHESTREACEGLLLALRTRAGDPVAAEQARTFDLSLIRGSLGDGTNLREIVRALLDASLGEPVKEPVLQTPAWRAWSQTRALALDA